MSTKITLSTTTHTTDLSTKTNDQALARLRNQLLEEAQRQGVDLNTLMERLAKSILPAQTIEPIDRKKLLCIYQIPQLDDVANFLEKNEFLEDLLLTAKSVIEKQFPDIPLYLLVRTDPDDGTQQLVIEIASDLTDSEERIDRLEMIYDDPWWHSVRGKSQNKMLFTLH